MASSDCDEFGERVWGMHSDWRSRKKGGSGGGGGGPGGVAPLLARGPLS